MSYTAHVVCKENIKRFLIFLPILFKIITSHINQILSYVFIYTITIVSSSDSSLQASCAISYLVLLSDLQLHHKPQILRSEVCLLFLHFHINMFSFPSLYVDSFFFFIFSF